MGRKDDEFEQRIKNNVRDHGCHVNFVFDPDGNEPDFAYSVGFPKTVHQPEVIVFGLPQQVMHFMINMVLSKCREGAHLEDGEEVDGLLEGHRCIVRRVHPSQIVPDYMNSAIWYHNEQKGDELLEFVQLVWPSTRDGLFPWEDGCAEAVQQSQPALYEARLNS